MCEALERYAKAYKDEGKHEGRIEGLEEGKIEGEQKTLRDAIQSLMIELKISKERAMQLLRIYQDQDGLYRYCVSR